MDEELAVADKINKLQMTKSVKEQKDITRQKEELTEERTMIVPLYNYLSVITIPFVILWTFINLLPDKAFPLKSVGKPLFNPYG